MQKEVYLVVVSILEGRNFPRRPKHQLMVECRFDGELLSTDPIDHNEAPDFTTELAWELDKKALHQHRLQRTPIKLQCYCVNTANSVREQIGYILLDLRMAQQKVKAPRWYNLLSSKYSRLKPAIKISMALEDDTPTQDVAFKARDAPPRQGKATTSEDVGGQMLLAKLNEEDGYFQIGPQENCYDMFILSVTVAFAANLEQLIPTTTSLPATGRGSYFFYYSLLGNDVTNDPFPDILNPEFVPERASVKIRSSVDILRLYFSTQPGIHIHLCSGDQSLGSTEISLSSLLKKSSKEIDIKPVVTEGAFTLVPPNLMRQQLEGSIEAKVGVSVSLRREEISSDSIQTPFLEDTRNYPTASVPAHISKHTTFRDDPDRDTGSLEKKEDTVKNTKKTESPELRRMPISPETAVSQRTSTPTPPPEVNPFAIETDDDACSIHSESGAETKPKKISDAVQDENQKTLLNENERTKKDKNPGPETTSYSESSGLTTTTTHPVLPAQAKHYRFSLHLKSIAELDVPFVCNVYLKYTYPFFGSAAPVITNPAVQIQKNIEATLPRSFCTFDFACSSALLHNTFNSIPLICELWHKDKESSDMLIGSTSVPLPLLVTQEPVQFVIPPKSEATTFAKEGVRFQCSTRIPVTSVQGPSKKVAELNVSMTLEDYGPVREQRFLLPDQKRNRANPLPLRKEPKPSAPIPPVEEPRESAEYQAAIELEMWKEQEEENFESKLKQKELARMKSLAEEWQRRDREREAMVTKRVTEYNRLESKLRKSLAEVGARESQLSINEQELTRIRNDLQRQNDTALSRAREATSRMKDDCVHQVQMERSRIKMLEDENSSLKSQLIDADKKYSLLEQKFHSYKLEQHNLPEVRLQSELQLVTLEKQELERKLDSVNKSKLHYKQQWGRALKELARFKQREQDHAMANLKRQQEELEQMRLKYFASEEREANKDGQRQILEIKAELDRLKCRDFEDKPPKTDPSTIVIGPTTMDDPYKHGLTLNKANEHIDEHVARLVEERDTLLRTGVYTREDRIISELDRQIRDAIARKSKV